MNGINEGKLPAGQPDEMPIGLGMQLAMNPEALSFFGSLSLAERSRVIAFVQCCATGEEAKRQIETAVQALSEGRTDLI